MQFQEELIDPTVSIAIGAVIRGDVTIGSESSVWYNAVIRGDTEQISIGNQTNIQDLCMLHADKGFPCVIGNQVTIGHSAIVHGATIEDECMIGMRAVVMNGAKIGKGSLIAVGAIVTEGVEVPPYSLVMGVPGKVRRDVSESEQEWIRRAASHYAEQAKKMS